MQTENGCRRLNSAADKADFGKDPAKYAPKYGAFCSYGVANGVITDIEGPEAFADIEMIAHAMGEIVRLKMKERGII